MALTPLHKMTLVPLTDAQLAARQYYQEVVDESLLHEGETDSLFQLIGQFVGGPRAVHGRAPLSLVKYCASVSRNHKDALLYAHSLNQLLKRRKGDLEWDHFLKAYSEGLPSAETLDEAWEAQRIDERRNQLDEDAAWA